MLRTFTAAAIALSLIAGPAFAEGQTPAPNASAPMIQPAKIHVKHVKHAKHIKHVKHAKYLKHVKHVAHVKHTKHLKQVKGVKRPTEKTRG